jgi:hypothetical protein
VPSNYNGVGARHASKVPCRSTLAEPKISHVVQKRLSASPSDDMSSALGCFQSQCHSSILIDATSGTERSGRWCSMQGPVRMFILEVRYSNSLERYLLRLVLPMCCSGIHLRSRTSLMLSRSACQLHLQMWRRALSVAFRASISATSGTEQSERWCNMQGPVLASSFGVRYSNLLARCLLRQVMPMCCSGLHLRSRQSPMLSRSACQLTCSGK